MPLAPATEIAWYYLFSVAIHPACRIICLFDLARFFISIGQLIEDVLHGNNEETTAALACICGLLLIQLVFTVRTIWTLHSSQANWLFLQSHYRAKLVLLLLQVVVYGYYVSAVFREANRYDKLGAYCVCVALVVMVELYLTYGLYSGFKVGLSAQFSLAVLEEAQEMRGKTVIGVPYVPKKRTPKAKVAFEIPLFDYTKGQS